MPDMLYKLQQDRVLRFCNVTHRQLIFNPPGYAQKMVVVVIININMTNNN